MSFYIRPYDEMEVADVRPNLDAFRDALSECNEETQNAMFALIESLALYLYGMGHPRTRAIAREQATLVVAQMVIKEKFDCLIIEAVKGA